MSTRIYQKHGVIDLVINDKIVQSLIYTNKEQRQEVINKWRMMYPIRPHQTRELIIKPNSHISWMKD